MENNNENQVSVPSNEPKSNQTGNNAGKPAKNYEIGPPEFFSHFFHENKYVLLTYRVIFLVLFIPIFIALFPITVPISIYQMMSEKIVPTVSEKNKNKKEESEEEDPPVPDI